MFKIGEVLTINGHSFRVAYENELSVTFERIRELRQGISFQVCVYGKVGDDVRQIDAIMAVREATGIGLKEAKDIVHGSDPVWARHIPESFAIALSNRLFEAGYRSHIEPCPEKL
jgi:ribosomal protein L7/L12